jgi:transposase
VCADPFHIVKLANHGRGRGPPGRLEQHPPRRGRGPSRTAGPGPPGPAAQLVKNTRWALLKDPAGWTDQQRQAITKLRRARQVLLRAWALNEGLRDPYRLPPASRPDAHHDAWLASASRCRIPAMLDLSRTIRRHRDQILAAVELACPTASWRGPTARSG